MIVSTSWASTLSSSTRPPDCASRGSPTDATRRAVIRAYNIVSADYFSGLGDRLTPAAIIPMHNARRSDRRAGIRYEATGLEGRHVRQQHGPQVPAAAAKRP